jgi:membrane protease subunit HflC
MPFLTKVFYVDNRLLSNDSDPGSVFTEDKKEMIVDAYSKWKVSDPLKFYETVRSLVGAQSRLDDIIYSQTREILGKHTLVEIVSGNRKGIRETITTNSRKAAESFGINVADVRIKRADLPEANSLAVYGRMEAERRRQAKLYRSEGEERSLEIRSAADRDRVKIMAGANKIAEELKGTADASATEIYASAYELDPGFFQFQRSHDAYRHSLREDTTLLLSSDQPFFRFLKEEEPLSSRQQSD